MELTLESQDFSGSVKYLETTLLSMLSTDVWINSGLATKWNRDAAGDSPVSFGPPFYQSTWENVLSWRFTSCLVPFFLFFLTQKFPKGNALRLAVFKNTMWEQSHGSVPINSWQFRFNTEPGKRQFPTVSVGWVQAFFPKNFTNVKGTQSPCQWGSSTKHHADATQPNCCESFHWYLWWSEFLFHGILSPNISGT